jgi:predicted alpha/beta superfamily hydrolase
MRQLITILILFCSLKIFGLDYQVDTIDFHSGILNENRRIYFYNSVDLNQTDSVIFVYLLDGEYSDYRYKKIQNDFPDKQIIGIGIVNTSRNRDMLPVNHPDKFLDFIDKELIPTIENDYKVKKRILFGHSFAGGFVIYSMIQSPRLFDKYIASSPTPIMDFIDPNIYEQLDKKLSTDIDFYFSYGSKDMKQVKKWAFKLNENLTYIKLYRINWKNEIYDGKNHNNCDLISLIYGLKY